jgi:hypothetical protein
MGVVGVPATAEGDGACMMKTIHTARLTLYLSLGDPSHSYLRYTFTEHGYCCGKSLVNCTPGTRPTVQRGDFSSTSEGRTEFSDGRCHFAAVITIDLVRRELWSLTWVVPPRQVG